MWLDFFRHYFWRGRAQVLLLLLVLVQVFAALQPAWYYWKFVGDLKHTALGGFGPQPWLYADLPVFGGGEEGEPLALFPSMMFVGFYRSCPGVFFRVFPRGRLCRMPYSMMRPDNMVHGGAVAPGRSVSTIAGPADTALRCSNRPREGRRWVGKRARRRRVEFLVHWAWKIAESDLQLHPTLNFSDYSSRRAPSWPRLIQRYGSSVRSPSSARADRLVLVLHAHGHPGQVARAGSAGSVVHAAGHARLPGVVVHERDAQRVGDYRRAMAPRHEADHPLLPPHGCQGDLSAERGRMGQRGAGETQEKLRSSTSFTLCRRAE